MVGSSPKPGGLFSKYFQVPAEVAHPPWATLTALSLWQSHLQAPLKLSGCPPPPRREGKPGASLALFYGALLLIKEKGLDPHWKKMRIGKQNLATQFIDDTRNSY